MSKSLPQRKPLTTPIDAGAVLQWYDRHARTLAWRTSPGDRAKGIKPDPYRVWLSEVMLQQTTVAAVGKFFARFVELWPTVADLAAAPLEAVLVEWAGLGYYARARNLHACAVAVVRDHGGVFPTTAEVLQTLPGIGAYTSAAIAAITGDERIAVLDGNVDRVMARYLALDVPVREAKDEIRAMVQASVPERAGDFAQALMDLGATICTPRVAMCMLCPLQPGCLGTRTAAPTSYPIKLEKAERPVRRGHAFVMLDGDGDVYLQTRPDKGLLAKMTEVPVSDWTAELAPPVYPVEPLIGEWRHRGQVVHIFTHFRLELEVWSAVIHNDYNLSTGWWADKEDLSYEALPTLFRKVLVQAGVE